MSGFEREEIAKRVEVAQEIYDYLNQVEPVRPKEVDDHINKALAAAEMVADRLSMAYEEKISYELERRSSEEGDSGT